MSKIQPGKAEFTVQGACFECMHMGFFVSESDAHGLQVERCDNCSVFSGDDEARAYAIRLAIQTLKKLGSSDSPRRRTGKRFKMLLECLEVTADQMDPPFWIEKPSAETLRGIVKGLQRETAESVTLLGVAYALQGMFIHWPSEGLEEPDVEFDNQYVQDNLDRDELAQMLRDAGCEVREEYGMTFWSVGKKAA